MTKDETFAMRPGFKALGLIVLLLVIGTPLLLWWQGRQEALGEAGAPAWQLKAEQVQTICADALGGAIQQSAQPIWDDTEWAWTGTVRLSEARPITRFSCVIADGGKPWITFY